MPAVFGGEEFSNWAHAPRKGPEEKVRHEIDFSDRLAGTDRISSVSWAGDPSGDLSFGSVSSGGEATEAIVGAGESGTFYRVTATIDTSDGLVLKRGYTLPVGDIYAEPEDLSMRRAAFMARQFLRDRPSDNELNFGELQSSFDDMRRAVRSALSDWNSTQPHTSHDLDQDGFQAGDDKLHIPPGTDPYVGAGVKSGSSQESMTAVLDPLVIVALERARIEIGTNGWFPRSLK